MALSLSNPRCDICQKRDVTQEASMWCFECDESLCSDCEMCHSHMNVTKCHQPIGIEEYLKLPSGIKTVKQECERHGLKFEFYCIKHDTTCCVRCIADDHRTCREIKPLTEVTTNVKKSFFLTDLQDRTKDFIEIAKKLLTDSSKRETKVNTETQAAYLSINAMRTEINQHLDKIQNELVSKISMKKGIELDIIASEIAKLEKLLQDVTSISDIIRIATDRVSERQTFFGIQTWNNELLHKEDDLRSVQDNVLKFDHAAIEINPTLIQLKTLLEDFGSIEFKYSERDVQQTQKERQCQNVVPESVTEQPNINLSKTHPFTLPIKNKDISITGCSAMESGEMIFADYRNQRLIILDTNYKLIRKIHISFIPYDVSSVDVDTVAVTSNKDKKLVLVNIRNGMTVKTVYEGEPCFGLCFKDGKFIVSVGNKQLKVIDFASKVQSTIETIEDATYCCVEDNILYYTGQDNDTIYCCEVTGEVRWKYDCGKANFPIGIAVDGKGYVFVSCKIGNKIIWINKTGTFSKTFLSNQDAINEPRAVCYSKALKAIIVCNKSDGKCFLVNITYSY